MDKEAKRLIEEIILIIILLSVTIPICVSASTNYNNRKSKIQCISNISIDIVNKNENKVIRLNNLNNEKTNTNLILKISKFSSRYVVELDGDIYDLNNIFYTEDEEFYYYNLGVYEINKYKEFDFKLILVEDNDYDDNIIYSFLTEAEFC